MTPDDPRHGTESGVWLHRSTKTPNCEACRAFKARYERGRLNDTIMGRPRLISATGSVRKLCALQRLGWPMEEIAQRGGWKGRDSLLWMIRQSTFVTRTNAERIDRIYRELCMTIGPSDITRRRAERAGYMPPLAWDDIDNPDETPTEWEYVAPDRLALIAELREEKADYDTALARLGLNHNALEKWCDNNNLRDWFNQINRDRLERDGRYCVPCQQSIRPGQQHWCGVTKEHVARFVGAA